MKFVPCRALILVAFCHLAVLPASPSEPSVGPRKALETHRLGLGKRTMALVGRTVVTEEGTRVGTIKDVLLDLPGNAVVGVALSDTNGTTTVLPCSAFTCVRDDRIAIDSWADAPDIRRAVSARRAAGTDLSSQSGEVVAKAVDFIVDIRAARIVYLVTERAAEKGLSDTRLVPPSVLEWQASAGRLSMKRSSAHYMAGPTLHRKFPVEMFTGAVAQGVYAHYGLGSEVLVSGENESRDARLTRSIMASLPQFGRKQLDVMAVTQEGRVVLEGVVASRDEERAVLAAAERVAGPGNVRNRLRLLGAGPGF